VRREEGNQSDGCGNVFRPYETQDASTAEDRPLAPLGFGRLLAGRSDRTVCGLLFLQLPASSLAANGLVAGSTDPALELAFLTLVPTDHAASHGSPYGPKVQADHPAYRTLPARLTALAGYG